MADKLVIDAIKMREASAALAEPFLVQVRALMVEHYPHHAAEGVERATEYEIAVAVQALLNAVQARASTSKENVELAVACVAGLGQAIGCIASGVPAMARPGLISVVNDRLMRAVDTVDRAMTPKGSA